MTTAQEILFGSGLRRARAPELAKAIGVSERTARRWMANPDLIPYEKLKIVIRLQNIPDDQVQTLMRMK